MAERESARVRILEAACDLIAADGIDDVRIARVAMKAGASTALVLDSLPATSSLRSGKGILRRVICRSTRCGGGKASPSYGLEIIG